MNNESALCGRRGPPGDRRSASAHYTFLAAKTVTFLPGQRCGPIGEAGPALPDQSTDGAISAARSLSTYCR
jgi:hypothetical protein